MGCAARRWAKNTQSDELVLEAVLKRAVSAHLRLDSEGIPTADGQFSPIGMTQEDLDSAQVGNKSPLRRSKSRRGAIPGVLLPLCCVFPELGRHRGWEGMKPGGKVGVPGGYVGHEQMPQKRIATASLTIANRSARSGLQKCFQSEVNRNAHHETSKPSNYKVNESE